MSASSDKKSANVAVSSLQRNPSGDSSDSSHKAPSLKSPRTARFAEATAVQSPIDGPQATSRPPFANAPPQTNHYVPQPQPSDVGFGYVNRHESVEMPNTDVDEYPRTPLKSPLKSAMKTPGAPPRDLTNILSPTFKEEDLLEKHEKFTDREQARDVRIKARVRIAKFFLRGVNFSCSLIVLSMLSTTFNIFNATKALPPRSSFTPWSPGQKIWPQLVLLVISCLSLVACLVVFYAYWKGGHRRAEKAAVYYSAFAVAWFVFSIVIWAIGAGILHGAKTTSNNHDMWGWSCLQNTRHVLYENEVAYDLVCRLQNWSLVCCIIEVVVETITIAVYGIVFYRFYSKNKLRKSMLNRDRARSDLYLAQLRSQSAPNTPGLNNMMPPYSARDGGWRPPADYYSNGSAAEDGVQYVSADTKPSNATPGQFKLQPPPIRIQQPTPKTEQVGFAPTPASAPAPVRSRDRTPSPPQAQDQRSPLLYDHYPAAAPTTEVYQPHAAAAPGEQVYEDVAIPGAYEAPLSPGAYTGAGEHDTTGAHFR